MCCFSRHTCERPAPDGAFYFELGLTPSRWAKHGETAVHAKAALPRAARDGVVAASPDAGPAPGYEVACLACPGGPTAEQWPRSVATAKHRANV